MTSQYSNQTSIWERPPNQYMSWNLVKKQTWWEKKKTEISVDGATKAEYSDQNLTKTEQIKLIEIWKKKKKKQLEVSNIPNPYQCTLHN